MSRTVKAAKPGWYDDPEMAHTRRYWDGSQWTEHRQAGPAEADPDAPSDVAVTVGLVTAILLPLVGLLIGLVLMTKRGNAGVGILALSLVGFVGWWWMLVYA